MTRDGTVTGDDGDPETTVADDLRKARISHVFLFELFAASLTTVFEGTS